MRERMGSYLESHLVKFQNVLIIHQLDLRQIQPCIPPVRFHSAIAQNEENRAHAEFLEDGDRDIVCVFVTVIKCQYDGLPGGNQFPLKNQPVVVECDGGESPSIQEPELIPELPLGNEFDLLGSLGVSREYPVIQEHPDVAADFRLPAFPGAGR